MAIDRDVIVVGAGLAGLCAALRLTEAGLEVTLVEGAAAVGGRVRTEHVDGLTLDRGFQLYNPAYPEGRRMLDHDALGLRPFEAGLLVAVGGRQHLLADPRRSPAQMWEGVRAPLGSITDKARFAAYALRAAYATAADLTAQDDAPAEVALRAAGIGDVLLDTVIRPFLTGVLLERDLVTSRRFVDLVLRSMVRATPGVPAGGMQAIPEQLAARLPPAALRLSTRATRVGPGEVDTEDGRLRARCVIVATDPAGAHSLVPSVPRPQMRSVTTWYHLADCEPRRLTRGRAFLLVDGGQRGPVVNSVVLTHAAPTYATGGRVLVSSSVLGTRTDETAARDVRGHLGLIHGVDSRSWTTLDPVPVRDALPAMPPPHLFRRSVDWGDGLFVCGDHRDSASIQGAMVSGRRTAEAALARLGLLTESSA
jgi:phytoene dehydrogenase-like protein